MVFARSPPRHPARPVWTATRVGAYYIMHTYVRVKETFFFFFFFLFFFGGEVFRIFFPTVFVG